MATEDQVILSMLLLNHYTIADIQAAQTDRNSALKGQCAPEKEMEHYLKTQALLPKARHSFSFRIRIRGFGS